MPPEAAAKSAVMADTMLPAAPVTRKTVFLSSVSPGAIGSRLLSQTQRSSAGRLCSRFRLLPDRAGFPRSGVRRSLRLLLRFEVNRLDQSVQTLSLISLGEARNCSS